MSSWSALGLPYPEASGYSYSIDAGLLRSSVSTAQPRQKRQYETNQRSFSVTWLVSYAQLQVAELYLQENGYSWFPLKLLSGYLAEPVVTLCVRLTDDYDVEPVGGGYYRIKASLEQLVERSVLATTALYPLEAVEGAYGGAPSPVTGNIYSIAPKDEVYPSPPSPFTGTLVQTVFWNAIGPPAGQPVPAPGEPYNYTNAVGRVEADYATSAPPAPYTGTLIQTVFWNAIGPPAGQSVPAPGEEYPYTNSAGRTEAECAASSPPAPFYGALEQTVFHAYVAVTGLNSEQCGGFTPSPFTGTLEHTP